jgi:hypothetical protein
VKPLFAFLFACLTSTAFAQPVYISGYVIKSNGDTLKGYIKYLDYFRWSVTPGSIKFKIDTNDHKPLLFNAKTIKEFSIKGHETYITYAGWVSADANKYPATGFSLDTSKKLDTLFLKQVVTGKHLTLYHQANRRKTRFFIAENNGPPIELVYHLYFENANKMISRPMYTSWLISLVNKYASGNERLMKEIVEMTFSQPDFEDFVKEINNSN